MSSDTCITVGFANRWSPFRQLNQLMSQVIANKVVLFELQSTLQRYKPDFLKLLQNPARNGLHREIVLNASKDGIYVIEQQNRVKRMIGQEAVDEALLMSDMFDLNQLFALELIIAGENLESRFPGMTRGTIAVMLYYDGRKSLISALNLLIGSRSGRTWSLKLNSEVTKIITHFTNELKEEGILYKCIEQLSQFDLKAEFDLLQRNRALGIPKYKRQILCDLEEMRKHLAEIIFNYAAQSDLNKTEVLRLIEFLSRKAELDSEGKLKSITTIIVMAVLHVIDVSLIQTCEDTDPRIMELPLIKHRGMILDIIKYIKDLDFIVPELKIMLQFCCAVSAKTLIAFPLNDMDMNEMELERMIDNAIENNVFDVLAKCLNETMFQEEFFMRRLHNIMCDFILLMPLKIKELRDKCDEVGRIIGAYIAEGITPPDTLPRHFEKFLNLMTQFYSEDKYQLSKEFWPAIEGGKDTSARESSLCKFIRSLIDSFFPLALHIPVVKFLKSLAICSPFNVFNLIKSTSIHQSSQFSLDNFMSLLTQYQNNVRGQDKVQNEVTNMRNVLPLSTYLQNMNYQISSNAESKLICAFLELINVIAEKDRACCLAIAENHQYSFISMLINILRNPILKEMKAAILNCLSGFATCASSVALAIWTKIDAILPSIAHSNTGIMSHSQWQSGIAVEIEDIEAKDEEYPITLGFLRLMRAIFTHHKALQHNVSSENCLNFIFNSILLKSSARAFKQQEEKWFIIKCCFDIMHVTIINYEPLTEGSNIKSAFSVMAQILQDTNLFKFIILVLEEVADSYSFSNAIGDKTSNKPITLMEESAYVGLQLLRTVCEKQEDFISMLHDIPGYPLALLSRLDGMFLNVNAKTGVTDRLLTLVRTTLLSPTISNEALQLLISLCKINPNIPSQTLMQLQASNYQYLKDDFLINHFVECLESPEKELRLSTLNFILICLETPNVNINSAYNIAHKVLGFDNKLTIKEAGQMGQSYSCFHAIMEFYDDIHNVNDHLTERQLGMKIIHRLCISPLTFENVLRFIRTTHDFMMKYLHNWEKNIMQNSQVFTDGLILSELRSFLQILALEIKITTQQNLKSYCTYYINFLMCDTKQRRVLHFVAPLLFQHTHPDPPSWDFFEAKAIVKTISECSMPNSSLIDLKALHQRIVNEVRSSGIQFGVLQQKSMQDEIKLILHYAASLNKSKQDLEVKLAYFESFRELIEVIISVDALSSLSEEQRSRILLEISHEMIRHSSIASTIPSFLVPISSIILMVSSDLSKLKSISPSNLIASIKSILNLLESSSISIWNQQKRTRIHLYTSLLYLTRTLPFGLLNEFKLSSRLLDKLCQDILSGHEIAKVLATLLLNDSDYNWINEIASNGTLKLLMDNLLTEDRELKANKCELSKTYYSFEAKMILLYRISCSPNGISLLIHHDIIGTLSSLQCFEMYPYLIGENIVCHKVFINVIKLLLVLSTTNNQQSFEEIGKFISIRSPIFNDIIRDIPTIKTTHEGKEALMNVAKIVSRFMNYASESLQRNLIGLFHHFSNCMPEYNQLVCDVLYGCFKLCRTNSITPIFTPSLTCHPSDISFGQQPLGMLVLILNNTCVQSTNTALNVSTIELAIYLLWHHLLLYTSVLRLSDEEEVQVRSLKNQVYGLGDLLVKIESLTKNNIFISAMTRRMKKIIELKK